MTHATLRWDRGTLLLAKLPAGSDPSSLPGVLWDPRTQCYRAPAHRYRELAAQLGGALVDETVCPFAGPELRPYQEAALCAWEIAGRRGTVVLPTGAGKTRLAAAVVARTGLSTLCLAPTRVLVNQWREALRAGGATNVGQLGDGIHDVRRITVATTASARLHAERHGTAFALLVVDEAHHHGTTDETLELYTAPYRLGLTATLPETEVALARLEAVIGPVVFRMGVPELAGNFLAPFDLVQVPLELELEERRAYDTDLSRFRSAYAAWARTSSDLAWPRFVAAASHSAEGRDALAAWRRTRQRLAYPSCKREALGELLRLHQQSKVLVFVRDNATAYAIARDHLIAPLTCDIGKPEREALLGHFARGDLSALVSARVLNEGVDVPDADVAILLGGSQGSREYVQRVGRVLRPSEGKRALVYELVVRGTHEVRQSERGRERLVAG
jgi:superfamily II DNA or RNA helicase